MGIVFPPLVVGLVWEGGSEKLEEKEPIARKQMALSSGASSISNESF